MKPYEKVDVSEAGLEDLVRQYPGLIEDGLVYLDHQKPAAGGRLDVLLADSGKSLVVAELKVVQDDGMLMQGVDYYDYVATHAETYSRLYDDGKIDPAQPVRLLLIAPSFSQTLANRCRWLDVPVSLFTFQCLQFNGENGAVPVFNEHPVPPPLEKPEIVTLDAHLSYITDPEVRSQAKAFLAEVGNWDLQAVSVEPIKHAVSMKVHGRVFAYLWTYRKYYRIATYDAEGNWVESLIRDEKDLDELMPRVRAAKERKQTPSQSPRGT